MPYRDEHRLFQTLDELAGDEDLRLRLGRAGSAGSTSVTVIPASSRAITHSLWMPRGKAVYSPPVPNYPTEGRATQSARCGLKACHYDAGMACELRSVWSHDISSIASRGSGG